MTIRNTRLVALALALAACGGAPTPSGAPASATTSGGEAISEEAVRAGGEPGSTEASMPPSAPTMTDDSAPPAPPNADDDGARSYELENESKQRNDALGRVLSSGTVDCSAATALRDRICELSERICAIAGRNDDDDIAARCSSSRTRCERAIASVGARCR